ncbi:MAG: hypothetical protein Q7T03_10395 [Deltaproteobacteria bacterium]|nr:hypothetical protein [Deltaproteobacteria bacterium]
MTTTNITAHANTVLLEPAGLYSLLETAAPEDLSESLVLLNDVAHQLGDNHLMASIYHARQGDWDHLLYAADRLKSIPRDHFTMAADKILMGRTFDLGAAPQARSLANSIFARSVNLEGLFLKRLDVFLSWDPDPEDTSLVERRILGLVRDVSLSDADLYEQLEENLQSLDFATLKSNPDLLVEKLRRFFKREVEVVAMYPYYDRTVDIEKRNVIVVVVNVGGEERVCYLKHMEESPRRESLGLRIHNLLTDSPIPFMASGYTSLQMGIRGIAWDLHPGFSTEQEWRSFNFNLGKADEFARLIQLGDRKAEDVLVLGTRVAQVDFGASFSRHESISRFAKKEYWDDFEKGKLEAQRIIYDRYVKNKNIVSALLHRINEDVVRMMNDQNLRGTYLVQKNPRDIIEEYLAELGVFGSLALGL